MILHKIIEPSQKIFKLEQKKLYPSAWNHQTLTNNRPQRSWGKVIFSEACVNNSVHRGGHAWLHWGGMHGYTGEGHAWFYLGGGACVILIGGGMRGFIWVGVCMVSFRGHAWFYSGGACMVLFGGACVVLFGGAYVVLFGGACMVFSVFPDTMRYGQWAGGTHPTGMHSCFAIQKAYCLHCVFMKGMTRGYDRVLRVVLISCH